MSPVNSVRKLQQQCHCLILHFLRLLLKAQICYNQSRLIQNYMKAVLELSSAFTPALSESVRLYGRGHCHEAESYL